MRGRKTKKTKEGCEDGCNRVNQWSKLRPSLLQLILTHIPLEDRGRFRSVCRSWRAVEKNTPPLPPLPWIMLKFGCRQEEEEEEEEVKMNYLNLRDGQICRIKLPGIMSVEEWRSSCRGWILAQDECSGIWLLLNPVTRKRIAVPGNNNWLHSYCNQKLFLVADPDFPKDVMVVLLGREYIWIFQPSLNIVEWRKRRLPANPAFGGFTNIIACNRKLYLLDSCKMNLAVVDPHQGEPSLLEMDRRPVSTELAGSDFLVESSGEILLVVHSGYQSRHFLDPAGRIHSQRLRCFQVFKADLDAMAWAKVESLDNRVLFLSKNSCFSIHAESGVKGDRICYLPPPGPDYLANWVEFHLDLGIPVPTSLQSDDLKPWMLFMPSLG